MTSPIIPDYTAIITDRQKFTERFNNYTHDEIIALCTTHHQPVNVVDRDPVNTENIYKIVEAFESYSIVDNIVYGVYIHKGYRYDGATVPRLTWTISGITPDGEIRAGATTHDFILDFKGRLPAYALVKYDILKRQHIPVTVATRISPALSAKIFNYINLREGIGAVRAKIAYLAVRSYWAVKSRLDPSWK